MQPQLISIQTGKVALHEGDLREQSPDAKPWTTAFFKTTVAGPVAVGPLGLTGDEQADRKNHGGPDKAILAYSADHYRLWHTETNETEIGFGGAGENLTIAGLDETQVCLGDSWRFGDVILQVSQPRQPCWKFARRWGIDDMVQRVQKTGRTGWYYRVLTQGLIRAPCEAELIARPHADWTVARANEVMYFRKDDLLAAGELADLDVLAEAWRKHFVQLVQKLSRS